MATDTVPRQKWWKIQWYSDGQYYPWSSMSPCFASHSLYLRRFSNRCTSHALEEEGSNILTNEADDTPEERKFIIKLDLIVVPYAVLAYWVKYIGPKPSSRI